MNTIRVLLSLTTNLNWPFHQLDVKNAFLNGELEDMQLSHGFEKNYGREKVCMLHQLLYGLKQSLIRGLWNDPWCIGGDFNVVRFPQECSGGN